MRVGVGVKANKFNTPRLQKFQLRKRLPYTASLILLTGSLDQVWTHNFSNSSIIHKENTKEIKLCLMSVWK